MGRIHEELKRLVGPEQAIQLVAETLQEHTGSPRNQEKSPPG